MHGASSSRERSFADRLLRSTWLRSLVAAVLIPVLVVGAFGGATFFAHAHGDDTLHVHAAPAEAGPRDWSACMGDSDAGEVAMGDGGTVGAVGKVGASESSEGLLITIPDDDQLRVRSLAVVASPPAQVWWAVWLGWTEPCVRTGSASPGGDPGGPRDLAPLSARQRLVRTSRALLI